MLYSHPLSSGVDYSTNNLKGVKSALSDRNAGGFIKQNAKLEIGENEKALLEGNDFEPISYAGMLMIFRDKCQAQEERQ